MPKRVTLGRGIGNDSMYWWRRRNRWRRASLDALHYDRLYREWLWQAWNATQERHA